jgi:hypothetical protein
MERLSSRLEAGIPEAVSNVPIEKGALGISGEQLIENSCWDRGVAVDVTVTELQIEDRLSGVVAGAGEHRRFHWNI